MREVIIEESSDGLVGFIENYISIKKLSEERQNVFYNKRNVIGMDIIELQCDTNFGELRLEICHYLKNKDISDGMTVRFRFNEENNQVIKSKVRNAIFEKDINNYTDGRLGTKIESITLQIKSVNEFINFFNSAVIDTEINTKNNVRSSIV